MKYLPEGLEAATIKKAHKDREDRRTKVYREKQVKAITKVLSSAKEETSNDKEWTLNIDILPELKEELEELGYNVTTYVDDGPQGSGYTFTNIKII